jgi:hypothetical protein
VALAAMALRGLATRTGPENVVTARSTATAPAQTLPSGD